MFNKLLSALTVAGALLLPVAAEAASALVTGNVNLRTGPGTEYYKIAVLPEGTQVEVYGCLQDYTWCDVSAGPTRGWVSSRYLSIFYENQVYAPYQPRVVVPFLSFDYGYWDRHYVDRPWYAQRPRPPHWRPGPPPPVQPAPPEWRPPVHRPDVRPNPPTNWQPDQPNWRPNPDWGSRPTPPVVRPQPDRPPVVRPQPDRPVRPRPAPNAPDELGPGMPGAPSGKRIWRPNFMNN